VKATSRTPTSDGASTSTRTRNAPPRTGLQAVAARSNRAALALATREHEADRLGRAVLGRARAIDALRGAEQRDPGERSPKPGEPLPPAIDAAMTDEGLSAGSVALHHDATAHTAARRRRALAYAHGTDIVFARGAYAPESSRGRELLAHELGHVVQQRREGAKRIDRQQPPERPRLETSVLGDMFYSAMDNAVSSEDELWTIITDRDLLYDEAEKIGGDLDDEDLEMLGTRLDVAMWRLAEITAEIELADDDDEETDDWVEVTFDDAARLVTEQLGSTDLDAYGLPSSFGSDLFFDYAAAHLAIYAADVVSALFKAYDEYDEQTAPLSLAETLDQVVADEFDRARPTLTDALNHAVDTWGDPFGLLELELEGAIDELRAARADFERADDELVRAAAGQKLGRLSRLILVIDNHLVGVDERIERRLAGERVASIGDTDEGPVGAVVENARAIAPAEDETLLFLGDDLSRLKSVEVQIDPAQMLYEDPNFTAVPNEAAYPYYTDQASLAALAVLADQLDQEANDLDAQRASLVPDSVDNLVDFATVYKRWYGFWSRQSRDNNWAYQFMEYVQSKIMPLAGMGGASGWIGRGFVTQSFGENVPRGDTETSAFSPELARIAFERREQSGGSLVGSGGKTDVEYKTAELTAGGQGPLDVSGEIATREAAHDNKREEALRVFDLIYQPGADQTSVAAQLDRYPSTPGPTSFWAGKDQESGRWGYREGWNYLLRTEVLTASGELIDVFEHKTMRDEVAKYLLAAVQYRGATRDPHYLTDASGEKVGDRVAKDKGLEYTQATAAARYLEGRPDWTSNPEADRLTSRIASAKKRIESHDASSLVYDLERRMDGFFAQADPATRVLAVIYIGVEEHNLDRELLAEFNASAIAWAVGIATAIEGVLWGLSLLGSWGKLAEASLRATLKAIGVSTDIAAFITLGQWALNAGMASSFGDAGGWAYIGRDVGKELAGMLRDYGIGKVREGLGALKNYAWPKSVPQNGKDLAKTLAPLFKDKGIGRELSWNMEDGIRKALDAGEGGILTKDAIDFLKAADPDAYARLKADYPEVFKGVHGALPAGVPAKSAAAAMHGLIAVSGLPPNVIGNVRVIDVPGNSVRIKAKNGRLEVEVGRKIGVDRTGLANLEGHLGSIGRLAKYTGPIGRVRHWLAKIGAAMGFLTGATRGGEAEEELRKLTEIKQKLETLRDEHEAKLGDFASRADSVTDADIDAEIANIDAQIDLYTRDLGNTSWGKGFIAAEGKSNITQLDEQGIIGADINDPAIRQKLLDLGYGINVNNVVYRPRGAGDTMEPLTTRGGKIDLSTYESPAAVQARLREELPQSSRTKFDATAAAAPKGTKVRLVEGIHDTGAKWSDIIPPAKRRELTKILIDGGVDPARAKELVNGLVNKPETLKVVVGTDPVRGAMDYRRGYATTGDNAEVHHFDPLYLGGGHDLLVAVPSKAHDKLHEFFDGLTIPSSGTPPGIRLQPNALQSAVKGATKPAVVSIDTTTGRVTYTLVEDLP
jgi:hypothetical protein